MSSSLKKYAVNQSKLKIAVKKVNSFFMK